MKQARYSNLHCFTSDDDDGGWTSPVYALFYSLHARLIDAESMVTILMKGVFLVEVILLPV